MRRAIEAGIQPSYWDMHGVEHHAPAEVLEQLLTAIGPLDATARPIVIRTAECASLPAGAEVRLEDGRALRLPAELPPGYHTIVDSHGQSRRLIVCPPAMWRPAEAKRISGVAIALYGLRSARNWGAGDVRDLIEFIDWSRDALGADLVALNPLHAIHNRQPYNTSPYLPLCTYYRNFLYIDVEAIEEFALASIQAEFHSPAVQSEISELRSSEFVEYERVAALKLRFLRMAFAAADKNSPDFRAYKTEQGALLEDFALYCTLDEYFRRTRPGTWLWTEWPEEYRSPSTEASRAFAAEHRDEIEFHQWMQWQLDRQLERAQAHARARGMTIGLYHDLALATDRFGCDLWASPEHFLNGCRVGSPPDGFSPEGQDWSFPPPNMTAHARDGYLLFIASIRQNARHGGALRMDHVMRLFRLFAITDGHTAREGAYIEQPWRDLLGILALESHRASIRIVGEDLGTITNEMREALSEWGVLGYKVLYFERRHDGSFLPSRDYAERAVATVTTHDLPSLGGFWIGADIEARRNAGLLPDDRDYERQRAERARDREALTRALVETGWQPPPNQAPVADSSFFLSAFDYLAKTPSEIFVINSEELTRDTAQQNLPGSTHQHPNWRRKMKQSVDELRRYDVEFVSKLRASLERAGR